MGIMSILRGLVALANAIPVVKQIVDTFINMYYNYNKEKIEQVTAEKEEVMNEAINQAGQAQTDDDRKKALAAIVAARK